MQLISLQNGLSGLSRTNAGSQVSRNPVQSTPTPTGANSITAKLGGNVAFRTGQTLFGQVMGQGRDGSFTLRFGNTTLNARSAVPLSVGQNIHVAVTGQTRGTVTLQMVTAGMSTMSGQDISQNLASLKMPLTEGNMSLATSMVEHGIPLTKENLTALKSALSQLPQNSNGTTSVNSTSVGATWFLQSGQLPDTPQNITTLSNFIASNPQLGAQLFNLQSEIKKLSRERGSGASAISERSMKALSQAPGLLGEMILEPSGTNKETRKASRKMFDLAKQAGIETNVGLVGPGETDWELADLMRELHDMLEREGQQNKQARRQLQGVMAALEGMQENMAALKLINGAYPDPGLAFYYLQVPLRSKHSEFAEVWVRYRADNEGNRQVDLQDTCLEFYLNLENLGPVCCRLTLFNNNVKLNMEAQNEGSASFLEDYLPVIRDRISTLGWHVSESQVDVSEVHSRELVEYNELSTMERINVEA